MALKHVDDVGIAPPGTGRRPRRYRSAALLLVVDSACSLLIAAAAPGPAYWVLLSTVLTVLLYLAGGLYVPRLQWSWLDDLPALLGRRVVALVLTLALMLQLDAGISWFDVVAAAVSSALVLAGRAAAYVAIRAVRRRGVIRHPTVLVGGGRVGAELDALLVQNRDLGLHPVGYVDVTPSQFIQRDGLPYLGRPEELEAVVERTSATVILAAFGEATDSLLSDKLRGEHASKCDLFVVPRLYEITRLKGIRDHVGAIPVIRIQRPRWSGLAPALKRSFDLVLASLALLLLSPVLLVCALLVRATGPQVIFKQERVGRRGELFELYKFRSMRPATPGETDASWDATRDPRMTTVGRVLRKTSLDELPQLINILRGEMTFVGPRPERPHFASQFSQEFVHYAHRHRVPVGLTGMAQVNGLRGSETPIGVRARYDNYYIENWSFWGDLKVILRTVREVVWARGG